MNEMLEQIKNELNEEQIEKLNDIETHPDYFSKLENKPKEEVINYINRWTIHSVPSLEGEEVADEIVEEPKKTRTPIPAKEKRAKIVSKISKYEELLAKAKQELIEFDTKEDLAIIKGLTPEQREYLEQLKKN